MVALARPADVTAWPHNGITALEMWDVIVDGRTLFARRDEPTFHESLAAAATALRRGAASRDGGALLPCVPWESIAIVGGAVNEAGLRAAFAAHDVALDLVSSDPCFVVEAVVAALGARAVVVDVGQTAIKSAGPGGTHRAARTRGGERAVVEPRAQLVGDIAAALLEASGDAAPSLVLLALPCEIHVCAGLLVLGPSSYPTAGDGHALASDVLAKAGLGGVNVAVVNDAVLAAWALAQTSPSPSRSRLVLTIGHGVGAAFAEAAAGETR